MPYERVTADIYISPEMREVLEKIKDNSSVANDLLKSRVHKDTLQEDYVNYISISKNDPTKISYMSQDRLAKCEEVGIDPWTFKGRYQCKFGGFVNKIFKNIPGPEVENFATLMKSVMEKDEMNFKVVSGEDIRYYYHVDRHAKEDGYGTLGVSCMRHPRCQPTCSLYVDNPSIFKMLILLDDNNKVLGRALLWNVDLGDETFRFMDRVYTHDERDVFHFKDWANKNGFAYKHKQSWNTPYLFQAKGNVFKKKMKITIPNWNYKLQEDYDGYPYLDTFKWFDKDNGTFFNWLPSRAEYSNRANLKTLISTCGEYNHVDQLALDELHDEYCYREEIAYLDYLQKNVNRRYLVYSNIFDVQIVECDAKWDEELHDYIYGEKYDNFNDHDILEERRKYLRDRNDNEMKRLKKLKKQIDNPNSDQFIEILNRHLNTYTQRSVSRNWEVTTSTDPIVEEIPQDEESQPDEPTQEVESDESVDTSGTNESTETQANGRSVRSAYADRLSYYDSFDFERLYSYGQPYGRPSSENEETQNEQSDENNESSENTELEF